MTLPRLDTSTAALGACLAAPLAAILALASLARFQADPVAAAETGYLAVAAGVALLAAAAAAGRPAAEGIVAPLLVATAVWTLPEGPARGAVVMALAAGALAVAAWRWLPAGGLPRPATVPASGSSASDAGDAGLAALPGAALALGVQVLLRGGELAGGSTFATLVLFVGFPAVGAAAVLALARLHGRRRALLVAAAVLAAGPGFRPATVAALLALAAVPLLLARDPLATLGPAGEPGLRPLVRSLARASALAVLAAPFAWDPRAAAAGLVAGVAGALALAATPPLTGGPHPGRSRLRPSSRWAWGGTLLAAAALGAALLLPGRPGGEAVVLAALVTLAVPALALPERARVSVALAALLLAFAAARGVLVEGALAAPAGLAALAVPRRGPVAAVQGAWSAALLAAASLAAAYPWLRPWPLPDALGLFGLAPGWPGALLAVAGLAALALLTWRAGRVGPAWAGGGEGAGAGLAAAALAALVLLHLPAAGAVPLGAGPVILDRERPAWSATLPPERRATPVRTIVVDSALANAADLPAGTPVATLRLRSPDRPDRLWTLRAGSETGEWAADRPDVEALRPPAPEPWASWVAEGGAFFGHRFRAFRRLPVETAPGAIDRVELALRPDLPPAVGLSVFHLELRP